jgi:hypothetical protein
MATKKNDDPIAVDAPEASQDVAESQGGSGWPEPGQEGFVHPDGTPQSVAQLEANKQAAADRAAAGSIIHGAPLGYARGRPGRRDAEGDRPCPRGRRGRRRAGRFQQGRQELMTDADRRDPHGSDSEPEEATEKPLDGRGGRRPGSHLQRGQETATADTTEKRG